MKADKQAVGNLLKTARGQIDGILKMIDEDRYCIDISTQLMAAQSVLKKANRLVIEAHLNHCVKEAVEQNNAQEKISEMMGVIDKLLK